ncbi:hypothetical protein EWM64_g3587 [Hericium alpestre]|uniref:Cytochrome P450 n=1 Tax=Hericium alpestre TaxID=135208 RepID=A0A4Z0A414_9AGAM|nr:hypothetical protein EWM64_g3587 [Hericium alpestre]
MRTYTFRDGTVIPEGTTVAVAQTATHRDEAYYQNASDFDAFRFLRLRETAAGKQREDVDDAQGEGGDWRHRLTGTGLGFLPFGGGRHACPGRFFAALELKCMMAYVLLRYDVKMADEGIRPRDQWFGPLCIPGGHANVLFRRRA